MLPNQIPDLVGFWTFQEQAGAARLSALVAAAPALTEVNGPIERVSDSRAPFGAHAARIRPGQWFRIPRAELGSLDIHGADAQVSVVAWLRRETDTHWQAIGGVWDESRLKRQYYLFLDAHYISDDETLLRTPTAGRLHGHVSAVGGPTPGHDYCVTYATGASRIPLGEWVCVAITYDGSHIRAYVNGRLDPVPRSNPFAYRGGVFDGGADGADFTVGANSAGGKMTNFFGGLIGGLAVYRRALTDAEIEAVAAR